VKRDGCLDRVRGVANDYVRAAGDGLDGYGIGKFSGVEIVINNKGGARLSFLGGVPWAIAGWFGYLRSHGAMVPGTRYDVCGLRVDGGPRR
jgi:hypothetical protein